MTTGTDLAGNLDNSLLSNLANYNRFQRSIDDDDDDDQKYDDDDDHYDYLNLNRASSVGKEKTLWQTQVKLFTRESSRCKITIITIIMITLQIIMITTTLITIIKTIKIITMIRLALTRRS